MKMLEDEFKIDDLLNIAPYGLFIIGLSGQIIFASKMAATRLGKTAKEIIGTTLTDYFPSDIAENRIRKGIDAINSGTPQSIEDNVGGRWYFSKIVPLKDKYEKITSLAIFSDDITERKKNETIIEKKNNDLRLAQRIASLGTWTLDPEAGVPEWSEEIYRIYERDPKLGPYPLAEYKNIFKREWWERFSSAIQGAITKGIPYDIDLKLEFPSGKEKWIHAICDPDPEIGPKGHKLRGIIQDITEQKKAEERLLRQQKAISLNNRIANVFLTSSGNEIFSQTLDVVLEALESPFGYFGYIDEEGNLNCPSMTRNIWDKCDIPDKSILFPKDIWGGLWGESLKKAKTILSNSGLKLPEGHIQITCAMAVPIIHHEELIGQFVVANKKEGYYQHEKYLLENAASQTAPILNSLMEKKAHEKEHKRMQARIEQAQKMEAVGNLAGGIAHDFNNILFPIIGMSDLMLEDLEPDSMIYEDALEINRAGKRAKDLVSQILSFSRQTEHEMMPIKFQKIIKEVLKLCRSTIPMNIRIEQNIQKDCGSIWANATQLHQIVMNLVTNAYHAVQDKNGNISVALKEMILGENDLSTLAVSPGKYAVFSVSDNGIGMSKEIQGKVFEPYFTTKEKGKGTGLGLAVVYGIVKNFKGDIQLYSEVGSGTTFNIFLPLMEKKACVESENINSEIQTGDNTKGDTCA